MSDKHKLEVKQIMSVQQRPSQPENIFTTDQNDNHNHHNA